MGRLPPGAPLVCNMPITHKVRNLCFFYCHISRFVVYWKSNMKPIDTSYRTQNLLKIVDAVQRTAKASYNLSYGWTEIVECWTRNEIYNEILKEKITTAEKAIEHFAFIAKVRSEYAQEVQSTAW